MPRHLRSRQPRTEPIGANYRRLVGAHLVSNVGDGISLVAYPWLASSLTRNPLLIIGVLLTQRLPWLFLSLPFGVMVDRRDRRNLMIGANVARAVITMLVAAVVLGQQSQLPGPDELMMLDDVSSFPTRTGPLVMLLVATFLLGVGEVLHDTSAMTILPQIVESDRLEEANGVLTTVERMANQVAGPLLGAFLLSTSLALPFLIDAVTFAGSAILLTAMTVIRPVAPGGPLSPSATPDFRSELSEGYRTLRGHEYLSLLATAAMVINIAGGMIFVIMIFFAQEVLGTSPFEYTALLLGSAFGAVVGGMTVGRAIDRFGTGTVFRVSGVGLGLALVVLGTTRSWVVAAAMMAGYSFSLSYWRILTVSLRQAITPNHLLGRVTGVFRFFSHGGIPLGALIGGLMVAVLSPVTGRIAALQAPMVVAGAMQLLLIVFVAPRLNTAKLDAVRDAGPSQFSPAESADSHHPSGDVTDP